MVRSWQISEWPAPDRLAWEEACRPGHRLQRGGPASHLKSVTQHDLARRYGLFLDHLDRRHGLDLERSATSRLTPETVGAYIEELQGRVGSVTVHGSIYKLRRAAQIIDPSLKLEWLTEIEADLNDAKRPRPKAGRLVFSGRIVAAGLSLFERAEADVKRTPLQRAQLVRNGLMIALLAVCPIRLKNYFSLTLGQSFVRQGEGRWIILPDIETKSRRLDHRAVPDELTVWIDLYVDRYRPLFPPSGNALWPSRYGGPLTYNAVERLVTSSTHQTLGVAINPHLFRHCATHTIAHTDGSRIGLASAVLQHTDARTTEKHYNLGYSVESSRTFANIVSGLSASPARSARRIDDPEKPIG